MTKDELIQLILDARTKQEIADAVKAIETYIADNGTDVDVLDAAEQLTLLNPKKKK